MKKIILINLALIITASGLFIINIKNQTIEEVNEIVKIQTLYEVKLEGAVVIPNIYKVISGITVGELIAYAQGFLNEADKNSVDVNKIIKFSQTINVLYEKGGEEIIPKNINTITYQELILIPYISDRIALDILIYRRINNEFQNLNELSNIKNIGEKTLEKLRPYFFI